MEGVLQFLGMEAKGTRLALVNEATVTIDEEEAIGPSGVGFLGCIFEAVDHGRELDAKFAYAAVGDVHAFIEAARAGKDDVVFYVALHLPDIARVSFEDVDGVKSDVITILLVELVEGRNLPPEGRSSVAAEDKHDRFLSMERRKADVAALVLRRQIEVWNLVTDRDGTLASARP